MIDSEQKLAAFLPVLRTAPWVAVDTEADSLHAYPEKVCLIQISTVSGERLVDPLAHLNLDPLLDALSGHELIMHGADYDLRLLRKHHEFVPSSIFDTMLAARLLGLRQFGLGHLVEKHLGVKLEKGPQKANWALRPLTERMERYARNDTHYLKPLADSLKPQLEAKGRLAWHQESCARLIQDSTTHRPADMDAVWRIKGSHLLERPALAILRELWQWREAEAVGAIEPFLRRHISERRSGGLMRAVARGQGLSPDHYPKPLRRICRRPSEGEKRRFADIQKRRDTNATALGIDPTLIASRGMLSDLAHDWDKHAGELMSWQRELLKG